MSRFLNLFLFVFVLHGVCFSQLNEGSYIKIDYIDVIASNEKKFIEKVSSDLKSVQNSRVNNNDLIYWRLYKVVFPGSRDAGYNYVMVTAASSMDPFEEEILSTTVKPASNIGNAIAALKSLHDRQYSEIWVVRNALELDSDNTPARFVTMDYMNVKPGKEFQYRMLEDEVAKPLHQERMNIERMDKWEMYELILPGGTDYGYNFATGNFFDRLWHIEFGFTEELINQTHPDTDIVSLTNQIAETRDLVRHELWQLVENVR